MIPAPEGMIPAPEGMIPAPFGAGHKKENLNFGLTAQFVLFSSQNGQNCMYTYTYTHTRMRIKRLVITPLKGCDTTLQGGKGAGKPKDDRATAKRNVA